MPNPRASVVAAVLEGDIHDIGKSIVKTLLVGAHFRVIDCGKDVSVAAVVKAVAESGAVAVCISGLISSVIPLVREVRTALRATGLSSVKVLAGGAALKQCSADPWAWISLVRPPSTPSITWGPCWTTSMLAVERILRTIGRQRCDRRR